MPRTRTAGRSDRRSALPWWATRTHPPGTADLRRPSAFSPPLRKDVNDRVGPEYRGPRDWMLESVRRQRAGGRERREGNRVDDPEDEADHREDDADDQARLGESRSGLSRALDLAQSDRTTDDSADRNHDSEDQRDDRED